MELDLGIYQKSLVQLSGFPWQLDICSFVFLENYTELLIASFVKLFVRTPANPCLSRAVRERVVTEQICEWELCWSVGVL